MDVSNDVKQSLLLEIDRYLEAGRELFPLHPGRKEPIHTSWQHRDYSRGELRRLVRAEGCNLGWRLDPLDLVVDIDPRHPMATEAEEKLTGLSGAGALADIWPTVDTGGLDQGRHYYLRLQKKVKLKSKTSVFPDIDFRHRGHYVLIAGCLHPSGRQYERDPFSPVEAPPVPSYLLEALEFPERDMSAIDPDSASLSLEEIATYLKAIRPEDHRGYDDWLSIGMACHAASGGSFEAQELWVEWSISDPMYADAEETNRARWLSFRTDRESGITAATLIKAAVDAGASPNAVSAECDFADVPVETAPSSMPMPDWVNHLQDEQTRPRLKDAVKQSARFDWDNWDKLRKEISKAYGARLPTIDKIKNQIEKDQKRQAKKRKGKSTDPAILIADALLDDSFDGGRHLVHAPNQVFYDYSGTHWSELKMNVVRGLTLPHAETVAADPELEASFRPSSMFTPVSQVLEAKTVKKHDVFRFTDTPPPVVNTTNCEIWISKDGRIKVMPHRPESYLLSCLGTKYDPRADCPLMDQTLLEIFRDNQNPEEMIRHFWEFAGYVLQPAKDIPVWAMWHGGGGNGKTILKNILASLLGPAVLPRVVSDFADSGKNNHALASLVGKLLLIDDDASVNKALPESALKKLAENDLLEANPKGRDAYTFRHSVTALVLINGWPKVRDLSRGMTRKSYIFPFCREFDESEYDLTRETTIIETESPGVLNRALEGYQRLRARGCFLEPAECLKAKDDWLRSANPMVDFMTSHVKTMPNGAYVPMGELFTAYRLWCQREGGIRYPLPVGRFELSLLQLNHRIEERDGDKALLGAKLRGDFE